MVKVKDLFMILFYLIVLFACDETISDIKHFHQKTAKKLKEIGEIEITKKGEMK